MYYTTSAKGMGVKDAGLNNFGNEWLLRLKAKGIIHKDCTLADNVFPMGYGLAVLKPPYWNRTIK